MCVSSSEQDGTVAVVQVNRQSGIDCREHSGKRPADRVLGVKMPGGKQIDSHLPRVRQVMVGKLAGELGIRPRLQRGRDIVRAASAKQSDPPHRASGIAAKHRRRTGHRTDVFREFA